MGRLLSALMTLMVYGADGLVQENPKTNVSECDDEDPGSPLFLTEYIESGKIEEGKCLARVPLTENLRVESYAGYLTVNKTYNSNHFFWYFPPLVADRTNAPIVVWLQGGPGATCFYGLFMENSPIRVFPDGSFVSRKLNWALHHHMIYIDSPVGTGYSFTNATEGYCNDQTQIGEELYSTLTQFFQLFPDLKENKIFVAGQSYGGKFAPALAYTIHKKNPTAELKMNLKGIAIGNGFTDPVNQLEYGKYLYQLGLIDWNQAKVFEEYEEKTKIYIQEEKWEEALTTYDTLVNGNLINGQSLFVKMTGYTLPFNVLHADNYNEELDFRPILGKSCFCRDIHVGNQPYNDGSLVKKYLRNEMMQSVAPWVSELLEHYQVLIYNGQLDIKVPYPLVTNYLRHLKFSAAEEYKTASRDVWKVDNKVAGYIKKAGNLVEVLVRDAGHMVPTDQPKWALDLITRFTYEKPFDGSINNLLNETEF
ncbi:unnamed protein product [Chrysodeixis includens]|uniref:Uncharacterized protein n=1 Tax=Chrysodeixis includens TaxID=689277 RepID=A0A9N8L4S6_CHRIL|nr:unnamed protein product [Chrysodeixis includens]